MLGNTRWGLTVLMVLVTMMMMMVLVYNDEHADGNGDNKGVNGDGDRGKMVLMIVTASDIPRLTISSPLDSVKREGVRGVSTIM